ncbi:MAG: winged helix-turn-helix domain-containing protein [Candidatus Acidiferrum sp.]
MSDNGGRSSRVHFRDFEVDVHTGELRKHGLKVKLHGQPFQVLAMLLERPGELVTREEIREKLWPQDTFIDFEHSVNSSIKRLREALGDDAARPRFIETLPRHGYRFIAAVETLVHNQIPNGNGEAQVVSAFQASSPETSQPVDQGEDGAAATAFPTKYGDPHIAPPKGAHRLSKKRVAAAMVSLLVALMALLIELNVFSLRDHLLLTASVPQIKSIAVLPLENLSHDPEQEYFADGMTEELITDLGKIGALRVISRTSVMRFKGTKKPLPEVARELNVDALVEGTVLRSGDRIRITANLLNARSDHHLWAETYERDLRDVLPLQEEVARAIATAITLKLTPQDQSRLTAASLVDPEAYRLYLEGRYQAGKRTLVGLQKSILLFQQAISKDRGYAPAYAGLSESYGLLPFWNGGPTMEAMSKAKTAAQMAVELDSSLAEAHAAMGFVLFYGDWDWPAAETELKRAIELKPGFVISHHWYAEYLSAMGRHDEAIAEIKRAQELDPLSPLLYGIGGEIYLLAHRYDEDIEQCQKALDLEPNYALALANLAWAHVGKGMYKEAAAEFLLADRALGLSNSSGEALAYALTGEKGKAVKILKRLRQPPGRFEFASIMAARIFSALDMKQDALEWLERAYQERDVYAPLWRVHPAFDPLRSEPRFQALLRKMNLPMRAS